jgi:hypothetical protein
MDELFCLIAQKPPNGLPNLLQKVHNGAYALDKYVSIPKIRFKIYLASPNSETAIFGPRQIFEVN